MVISVKWLGHASFKIKDENKTIYIDPYMGDYDEKADLILITHSHYDHCDPIKVKTILKNKGLVIAPSDCNRKITGKIKSLGPGEQILIGNTEINVVKAYNFKRFKVPGKPFHPKDFGVGYLIKIHGKIIYHAGDTDFIPEMKKLKNIYLALIPIGGTYTMDNVEAAKATLKIKPKMVIPMHIWEEDPNEFKSLIELEPKNKIKVITINPGEKVELV